MDKFINRSSNSSIGLDLLANYEKSIKKYGEKPIPKTNEITTLVDKKETLDDLIGEFKNYFTKRIEDFDPFKSNSDLLKNIWIYWLINYKNREIYVDIMDIIKKIDIENEEEE